MNKDIIVINFQGMQANLYKFYLNWTSALLKESYKYVRWFSIDTFDDYSLIVLVGFFGD